MTDKTKQSKGNWHATKEPGQDREGVGQKEGTEKERERENEREQDRERERLEFSEHSESLRDE